MTVIGSEYISQYWDLEEILNIVQYVTQFWELTIYIWLWQYALFKFTNKLELYFAFVWIYAP